MIPARLLDRLLRLAARKSLPGVTDQDRKQYTAVRRQILAWVQRRPMSVAVLIRVHRLIRAAEAMAGGGGGRIILVDLNSVV